MSDVTSVDSKDGQQDQPASPICVNNHQTNNLDMKQSESKEEACGDVGPAKPMVAPALRVEELREKNALGVASSSEDELGSQALSDSDCVKETPFVEPDEELIQRIIKQVEFLFGDANILKDKFLLKHVRRNKQGYVSLKLITSFKKVKSMSRDYRVVAFSLRQSDKLEVNEDGTKVRRVAPLPEYDETTPSRTVICVNMPVDPPTVESVAELFNKCGDIALIRILKPTSTIPPDVKKFLTKHPELGNTTCAVVEFEQHEHAKKALSMSDKDDWRSGMRVAILSEPKKEKPESKAGKLAEEDKKGDKSDSEGGKPREEKKKRNKNNKKRPKSQDMTRAGSPLPSSGSELDGDQCYNRPRANSGGHGMRQRNSLSPMQDPNLLTPNTTPRSTPHSSPRSSPRASPRTSPASRRRHPHGLSPLAADLAVARSGSPDMRKRGDSIGEASDGSQPSSPWVKRRLQAAAEASGGKNPSPIASPRLGRKPGQMEGVLRQPHGPDGTKGFAPGAGRGKLWRVDNIKNEVI